MSFTTEYDIMFPVRMTSELKSEGQAAEILGIIFISSQKPNCLQGSYEAYVS
jgi:hypothetical protein